ncbi:MAG: hypothetical protein JO372_17865, partial [Solirubrobacterales bacterium]|nr:hypothetical protein [Solirubrobacterales bacterium]
VAYKHHADDVVGLPEGFAVLARSERCAVEAIAAPARRWWGTQFHPESFTEAHPDGARVLRNFFALAGLDARRPEQLSLGNLDNSRELGLKSGPVRSWTITIEESAAGRSPAGGKR